MGARILPFISTAVVAQAASSAPKAAAESAADPWYKGTAVLAVILVFHIIVCLALIVSVLLHSGKGGGLSGVLGSAAGSLFSGSYVVEKNLDRITIVLGCVFAVTTILLVIVLAPGQATTAPGSSTAMPPISTQVVPQ